MGDERKRTSLHSKLKGFLAIVTAHSTKPVSNEEAKELMTRAEEVFADFKAVQEKMETTATDDAAFTVQEKVGQDVENTFSLVRRKLRTIIEASRTTATSSSTGTSSAAVKLPTIPLATFDGKFENWLAFKDLFSGQIVHKASLTGAEKLQYLKQSLKGEPQSLVDDLPTTDANYTEAWKILNERYDNKREIVRSHVTKILHLKQLKTESATELQLLSDSFVKSLRSLATQGCATDKWDELTVVMLEDKLDSYTRREWAKCQTGTNLAKFDELITFLKGHIRGLQAAGRDSARTQTAQRGDKQVKVHHASAEVGQCPICKGSHGIQGCQEFLAKGPKERSSMAKMAHLCFNCLRLDHRIKDCTSTRRCKTCGSKHHTLLHEERQPNQTPAASTSQEVTGNHVSVDTRGIVMTVMLHVEDKHGVRQPCRAFLDPGATADFITEACTSRLGLQRQAGRVSVKGFGDTKVGTTKGIVRTTLFSRINQNDKVDVELHIMNKLTGTLPSLKCQSERWSHLQGLKLANPRWYQPGPIDIVLGIKYFSKVLLTQRIAGATDEDPVAWESIFGWIVAGACSTDESIPMISYHITVDPIMEQLKKFWEVEEPARKRILTVEEKECEQHFRSTHKRDAEGRFVVGVPFDMTKKTALGASRDIALRRLRQVERRLQKNPELSSQYTAFMKEYEELGHMRQLSESQSIEEKGKTNYLCHHFVTNDSSTTTKLRVVFDGSASTSSGISFNSTMLVGATLQDELYDILLRLRVHAVVIKGDIAKMFRQFQLRPEDAKFHRVLWRESPTAPVKDYELTTVTYGTACAPNLATRCVVQLGLDCAETFPEASKALLSDTYVDDILTGKETPEDAISLVAELNSACSTAGLELRKWSSNNLQVMQAIPEEMRETNQLVFDDNELVKALGVQWHPQSDEFKFKSVKFSENRRTTKRSLLSNLASVFDPLGLISCVTLRGKLLLQELWKLPVGWDDEIPPSTQQQWEELKTDLQRLGELNVPRRITVGGSVSIELHGFSDSSELGLGGLVYLRSVMPNGSVEVRFVTSKTRVAPLRQVTLPRLELCAAVLTAELITHVRECLKLDAELFLWSDSTITLTWIAASPRKWKTFVANRVATIQELTPVSAWRHVAGIENPADLASRGCTVQQLSDNRFWWEGPQWLSEPTLPVFPQEPVDDQNLEERKEVVANQVTIDDRRLLQRFPSLTKLKRYTAWYLRYLKGKKNKTFKQGPLTALELQVSFAIWIKKVQQQYFSDEWEKLMKGDQVSVKSKLKSLYPFIDGSGLLRVAGRLQNAELPEERKHQLILPGDSRLT